MVLLVDNTYREREQSLFYQTHKLTIRQWISCCNRNDSQRCAEPMR